MPQNPPLTPAGAQPQHLLLEHALAAEMISDMAGSVSKRLDVLATWLLAGYGAAVVLLLDSDRSSLVSAWAVRHGLFLFLWATVAIVVEKYLSVMVVGGSKAAAEARAAVERHYSRYAGQPNGPELNMQEVTTAFAESLWQPARWFARRAYRKAFAGDLLHGPRNLMRFAQLQSLFVLVEIVLFLIALGTMARNAGP